ncbi:MAG: hypothetical protein LBT30_00595 [Clostridiales bacterium]|nr:hypothetical protein [Clostridiales bacterium]
MRNKQRLGFYAKTSILIATLLLVVVSMASCNWLESFFKPKPNAGVKDIVLYIADAIPSDDDGDGYTSLSVNVATIGHSTEALYLYSALVELQDLERITFGGTSSSYGFYLDTFGGLTLGTGEFVYFYIRLQNDKFDKQLMDKDFTAPLSYNGKIFYAANYGVEYFALADGMEIIVTKIKY